MITRVLSEISGLKKTTTEGDAPFMGKPFCFGITGKWGMKYVPDGLSKYPVLVIGETTNQANHDEGRVWRRNYCWAIWVWFNLVPLYRLMGRYFSVSDMMSLILSLPCPFFVLIGRSYWADKLTGVRKKQWKVDGFTLSVGWAWGRNKCLFFSDSCSQKNWQMKRCLSQLYCSDHLLLKYE